MNELMKQAQQIIQSFGKTFYKFINVINFDLHSLDFRLLIFEQIFELFTAVPYVTVFN